MSRMVTLDPGPRLLVGIAAEASMNTIAPSCDRRSRRAGRPLPGRHREAGDVDRGGEQPARAGVGPQLVVAQLRGRGGDDQGAKIIAGEGDAGGVGGAGRDPVDQGPVGGVAPHLSPAPDGHPQVVGGVHGDPVREPIVQPQVHPPRSHRTRRWVVVPQDRKSTRLNSSHTVISYAVFCLKKKKKTKKAIKTKKKKKKQKIKNKK